MCLYICTAGVTVMFIISVLFPHNCLSIILLCQLQRLCHIFLDFIILTITIFKVPEEPKKLAREERVSIAVPKRKVSPPPEGTPAHGLSYEQTVLMQYHQSFKPAGLAPLLKF